LLSGFPSFVLDELGLATATAASTNRPLTRRTYQLPSDPRTRFGVCPWAPVVPWAALKQYGGYSDCGSEEPIASPGIDKPINGCTGPHE